MKLKNIQLKEILIKDRQRKDLGDIDELAQDIKKNGLICPIAVVGASAPYKLAAGERRLRAVEKLGWEDIACNIYDHDLSDLELKSIELSENIRRKQLSFVEECNAKRDLHNLQQKIRGVALPGSTSGHSLRDTTEMVGQKSHKSVLEDIRLADAMEKFPEIDWKKCKTKTEARAILKRMDAVFVRDELAKRAEEVLGPKTRRLVDSFIVMDFFEHVSKLPDQAFDLVEVDPPYGIDLPAEKLHDSKVSRFDIVYGDTYNEVDRDKYPKFIEEVLHELHRVMTERSWLIFWFAPEPWFETIYNSIVRAGFKTRRMPGIWTKPSGQTNRPELYLANSHEMFFYAGKSEAKIPVESRGRSSDFPFAPVHPSKKYHPTQKPIELEKEILRTFSWKGSRIYVPFCGSGATLRAAHELEMSAIGCDLGKEYKDGFVSEIVGG